MGTIEKRGTNSWRVGERLSTEQGRDWIRRPLKFPPTMSEAEQRRAAEVELARIKIEIDQGQAAPQQELTVRALAEIWLTEHVDPNCKATTAATYRALLNGRILPAIGDIPVSKLKPIDLQHMFTELHTAPKRTTALPPDQRRRATDRSRPAAPEATLSDRTVRHIYDTLNYMFNKGVRWKLIRRNPLEDVDRPRARRRKIKSLDDDQAVDLLRKLEGEELPFRCAVLLALLCGLRLSEVGGLRLSDVDWEHSAINVTQALHYVPAVGNYMDTPKSEAGERVVTLPQGMMDLLAEVRRYQEEMAFLLEDRWKGDGRIVTAWDGRPLHHDTPSKAFRSFADRNGFEGVRFHDLRHTHASILLANNLDVVAVAARIGHESPETTLRNYAHALQRRDRESADAMQQLLDRAGDTTKKVPNPGDNSGDT